MHDVLKRQYSPGWEQTAWPESTFSLYFSQTSSKTLPDLAVNPPYHLEKVCLSKPDLRADCQTETKVASLCSSSDFVKFYRRYKLTGTASPRKKKEKSQRLPC
ncbi:MAG: hypothetical protein AB1461_08450 [Thermodesulfobacteriota bacterium]